MNFELRHFDTTLLCFSATEDSNTPEIKILSLDAVICNTDRHFGNFL